ncbi:hypothetical protein O181_120320 [Austropuccinia psidii MF-1]|uniref:Uncharacterized protein n=1 Tax=Austropuccinia psidii MF-1 TaxID=1389203 RepID=A0A9Q3KFK1_9BASI|nr:hypothetical protein [Austropuccinia psidii MF-1]
MAESTQLQKDKGQLMNSKLINCIIPKLIKLFYLQKRSYTATRSLSGHLQSQPEGLQQCIAEQRVPDTCRSVEKLHEFLPDCEKIPWPSQHLQVTQWMASIGGKEEHDSLNSRMEEKQPSTTQTSAKNSPSDQKQQFQREKPATSSKQGQRKGTSHKTLQPAIHDSKDQQDAMENVFQMARTMMELQKKGEARLKYHKSFLTFLMLSQSCMKL